MSWLANVALGLYVILVAVTFRFIRAHWINPPWRETKFLDRIPAYCMACGWPLFWPVWGFLRGVLRNAERSGL